MAQGTMKRCTVWLSAFGGGDRWSPHKILSSRKVSLSELPRLKRTARGLLKQGKVPTSQDFGRYGAPEIQTVDVMKSCPGKSPRQVFTCSKVWGKVRCSAPPTGRYD